MGERRNKRSLWVRKADVLIGRILWARCCVPSASRRLRNLQVQFSRLADVATRRRQIWLLRMEGICSRGHKLSVLSGLRTVYMLCSAENPHIDKESVRTLILYDRSHCREIPCQ